MLHFSCPKCGEYYELEDDDMVGMKVSCETCGSRFLVPVNGEDACLLLSKSRRTSRSPARRERSHEQVEPQMDATSDLDEPPFETFDFEQYLQDAEAGNSDAQCKVAECYGKGIGIEQNEAEAAKWFRKAAEQGDGYAQDSLGMCYEYGIGVCRDFKTVIEWYEMSAAQGNESAKMRTDW